MLKVEITRELIGDIFGWVGNVFSIIFFFAPFISIRQLIKGEIALSTIPVPLYVFSILNCLLWSSYGILIGEAQMIVCNVLGGSLTFVWIMIYLFYLVKKKLLYFIGTLFIVLDLSFQIVFFSFFIGNKGEKLQKSISYAAMVVNVLTFAAPGIKMYTVIKTNNYKLLPIASSIAAFFCSMSWTIYGLVLLEIGVIVPNIMGMVFAIMQLIVFAIALINYKKEGIIKTEEQKGPKVEPITEQEKPLFQEQTNQTTA